MKTQEIDICFLDCKSVLTCYVDTLNIKNNIVHDYVSKYKNSPFIEEHIVATNRIYGKL